MFYRFTGEGKGRFSRGGEDKKALDEALYAVELEGVLPLYARHLGGRGALHGQEARALPLHVIAHVDRLGFGQGKGEVDDILTLNFVGVAVALGRFDSEFGLAEAVEDGEHKQGIEDLERRDRLSEEDAEDCTLSAAALDGREVGELRAVLVVAAEG